MEQLQFPRTMVGGKSLSRIIIGTNWILGYSHTTSAADRVIRHFNNGREAMAGLLETYLQYGIDTLMGPMEASQDLRDGIKLAEDRSGKGIIVVDTPVLNVNDSDSARKEAEARIKQSKEWGSTFCLPHHTSVEQMVNKNLQQIPRLPDYLKMVRDHDMIPGLSAHMPECIVYSDLNEYDVETYIQIYNCVGFLMQVEVEYIHKVIWSAKKPVMSIKSMAAGRVSPFVGITFSFSTLREQDMVTLGCMTPNEVHEDVEIARAAIERRAPNTEGRNSPSKTSIMK
jgi:hypothetical protein